MKSIRDEKGVLSRTVEIKHGQNSGMQGTITVERYCR